MFLISGHSSCIPVAGGLLAYCKCLADHRKVKIDWLEFLQHAAVLVLQSADRIHQLFAIAACLFTNMATNTEQVQLVALVMALVASYLMLQ